MKNVSKFLSMLLAVVMVLGIAGASAESVAYVRSDDEDIYEEVLGEFEALMAAAEAAESIDERFILEAQAEAYLLDSAVMIPTVSVKTMITGPMQDTILRNRSNPSTYAAHASDAISTAPTKWLSP